MSYIIALVLSLTAILGLSQPASASLPASQPTSQASILSVFQPASPPASIACEEDMPCWDCATMGNLQCGPIAHDVDAFQSIDAMGIGVQATNAGKPMMLSYHHSVTSQPTREDLELGQFYIPSANVEGLWHFMQWDVVTPC